MLVQKTIWTRSVVVTLLLHTYISTMYAVAQAQEVGDAIDSTELQQPTEEDLAAFRQSYKRYSDRMNDFRTETLEMVEVTKQDALATIQAEYAGSMTELEQDKEELQNTAISKFEQFIAKYPDKEAGAEIRFQLADIYYKKAEAEYNTLSLEAFEMLDANPDLELKVEKDLSRPVALYEEIIEKFPNSKIMDGALYMLAWCYSDDKADAFNVEKAVANYKRITTDFPKSNFIADANYFMGVYYFERNDNGSKKGDASDVQLALQYFQKAVNLSKPSDKQYSTIYEYALYHLAWTNYKLNNYETALSLFVQAQDYSERKKRDTGVAANVMEESIEYTAISFIDMIFDGEKYSWSNAVTAVQLANDYYVANGEREYAPLVFVDMGKKFEDQNDLDGAIEVYEYLQSKWPYAPENPVYQKKIAELFAKQGDADGHYQAMQRLTEVYAENGDWWIRNRNNPDAQDIARGYIEATLLDVAYGLYNQAYESQDPNDFMVAAEGFQSYLRKFPFAEDYYDAQWYKADSLFSAEKFMEAIDEYILLVKSGKDHDRGELAQLRILLIANALAKNTHAGNFSTLAPDIENVVLQKEILPNKSERFIYKINPESTRFIEAYDKSVVLDFPSRISVVEGKLEKSEDPKTQEKLGMLTTELQGAQEYFASSIKSYEYNIAEIYYAHGQFDLAREKFQKIVDQWPDSVEATYAANLIVGMYQTQMNWLKVQELARHFMQLPLGPDNRIDPSFAKLEQNATLLLIVEQVTLAQSLMSAGKVEEATKEYNLAAKGFENYIASYTNISEDEYAQTLLRAGNMYDLGGNAEEANRIYRDYVRKFPGKEASRSLLFSIAVNHQNALELQEAIDYYETLYQQTYGKGVPYADAKIAKLNAAVLKAGLGQYKEAAEGIEDYVKKFPNEENAEGIFFSAGEYWEKVADWRALEFYTRYLKKYKGEDPDRTMLAYHKRIEIYQKDPKGKSGEIKKEWKELNKAYEEMLAKGIDSGLMRAYAAEYALQDIEPMLADLFSVKYTKSDDKNVVVLQETLLKLQEVEVKCVSYKDTYKDFSAIIASAYCAGSAQLFVASFLEKYPIPDGLDADFEVIFLENLEKQSLPMRETGIQALKTAIALSEKQGRWIDWTDKALVALSKESPKDYPPEKKEMRFFVESQYVPYKGPISIAVEESNMVPVDQPGDEIPPVENVTPEDNAPNPEQDMPEEQSPMPEENIEQPNPEDANEPGSEDPQ